MGQVVRNQSSPITGAEKDKGLIFLIQGYSIQDGPGIRTTVFMKGCPLDCLWCQNPESKERCPELMSHADKCMACGHCIEVCSMGALTLSETEGRKIDRAKCNNCLECVNVCPAGALTGVGEYMSVNQVVSEIEKDAIFYYRSGGGVTISGGEPLFQERFVYELLKACKQRGLHTALDTCGYADWPTMKKMLKHVDLVLYDIKHMDPGLHRKATGKSNEVILKNLRRIPHSVRVWLRIPLIPGYNDSDENLNEVGRLGKEIGVEKVSILPFNRFGEAKYPNMGQAFTMAEIQPPTQERIKEAEERIKRFGLKTTIGQ